MAAKTRCNELQSRAQGIWGGGEDMSHATDWNEEQKPYIQFSIQSITAEGVTGMSAVLLIIAIIVSPKYTEHWMAA